MLFSILVSDESQVNNFERYVSSCVFPNIILPLITASPRLVSAPLVAKVPSPLILKDSLPPVCIIISASFPSYKLRIVKSCVVPPYAKLAEYCPAAILSSESFTTNAPSLTFNLSPVARLVSLITNPPCALSYFNSVAPPNWVLLALNCNSPLLPATCGAEPVYGFRGIFKEVPACTPLPVVKRLN